MLKRFMHNLTRPQVHDLARKRDIEGLVWALARGDLGAQYPRDPEAAAEALIKIGVDSVPILTKVLERRTENWQLRKNAAQVLGRLKAVNAVPVLRAAVDDGNRNVEQGAMWALCVMGEKRALEPLKRKLRDPHTSLYTKAVAASSLVTLTQTVAEIRSDVVAAFLDLMRQIAEFHEHLDRGTVPPELIAESVKLHQQQYRYYLQGFTDEALDQDSEIALLREKLAQFNNGVIVEGLKRLKPESEVALIEVARADESPASDTAKWILAKLKDKRDEVKA